MELTPKQWAMLYKGRLEREKRYFKEIHTLIAWQTMHLMNATGNFKEPITMEKLLKEVENQQEKPVEKMDFNETLRYVKQ